MGVVTKYISKVGKDYKISEHFKLREFACKDGTDKVLYSTELFEMLEKLRAYGGYTITINSGYRTQAYNKKIGGGSKSQHILGKAADIVVKKDGKIVSAKLICCLCQTLGFKGVAYISENAVHLDMRDSGTYRGDERRGYSGNVGGDFYSYFKVAKSTITAMKVKEEPKKEVAVENKASEWAKQSWAKASAKGIVDGSNPQEPATREQVIVILDRLGLIK